MTRRTFLHSLGLGLVVSAASRADGTEFPPQWLLEPRYFLNRSHFLMRGLTNAYVALPALFSGTSWRDLVSRQQPAILTGMPASPTITSGKGRTTCRGGAGEVRLDGTDDYAEATSVVSGGLVACTISIRVKPGDTTTDMYLLDYGVSNADSRTLLAGFQDGFWNVYRGGYPQGDDPTFSQMAMSGLNRWDHVVYTADGTTVFGYLNGKLTSTANGFLSLNAAPTIVSIGRPIATASANFNGAVESVFLWSRVLSAREVLALYTEMVRGYPTLLQHPPGTRKIAAGSQATSIRHRGRTW